MTQNPSHTQVAFQAALSEPAMRLGQINVISTVRMGFHLVVDPELRNCNYLLARFFLLAIWPVENWDLMAQVLPNQPIVLRWYVVEMPRKKGCISLCDGTYHNYILEKYIGTLGCWTYKFWCQRPKRNMSTHRSFIAAVWLLPHLLLFSCPLSLPLAFLFLSSTFLGLPKPQYSCRRSWERLKRTHLTVSTYGLRRKGSGLFVVMRNNLIETSNLEVGGDNQAFFLISRCETIDKIVYDLILIDFIILSGSLRMKRSL